MKTKKWAIIFLLFAGIILFAVQSAIGGCEVSNLDPLLPDDNAPGTKLEGPITIFYQLPDGATSGPAFMYWFMRLRKGSTFYTFAGGPADIIFPSDLLDVIDGVPYILENFFNDTVVPALYPECTLNPDICPNIVLKSYDMEVDWDAEPGGEEFDSGLYYFIANIVVAIQE
jgi:hypothetical protein